MKLKDWRTAAIVGYSILSCTTQERYAANSVVKFRHVHGGWKTPIDL